MHSIFGLLPDDGVIGFHDLVGALGASFGREAVHENRIRRLPHDVSRDAETGEIFFTLRGFIFLAHGCPDVGVDGVRPSDVVQVMADDALADSRVVASINRRLIWRVVFRSQTHEFKR